MLSSNLLSLLPGSLLSTFLRSLLPSIVWPLLSSYVWPVLPTFSLWSLLPTAFMSSSGNIFSIKIKFFFSHDILRLIFQRCKSRELKGSVLITQCECVKRNGLQLDCPRSECHGRPMCTTKPWAACCPSNYMWRYTNVTMGKPTNPRPSEICRAKGPTCNPCVIDDPCSQCL